MQTNNYDKQAQALAVSPLDGRYGARLQHLSAYFSEFALMRSRVYTELIFLEALDETGLFPPLTAKEKERIAFFKENFALKDYFRIKEIEATIQHDVKSCEMFLREQLELRQPNMIHFGLTSEDVNNLAYSFLMRDYLHKAQLPRLKEVLNVLLTMVREWRSVPFPARTHGQMASPTTAGKEIAVYLSRLLRLYRLLKDFRFSGKLNGATGNYSALKAAFPDYDWMAFSRRFLQKHGLEANLVTTQIEDHDTWASYLNWVKQINNIVLDLDRDVWLYLTLGYFILAAEKKAVGSSTMPHKVNPINFENSEGNMQVSIALINGLVDKLGNSRLQRDLSDSTVTRNIGVALAHSELALQETLRGLKKLAVNEPYCLHELEAHPELLAEPIQTILRREGVDDPYALLKEVTRGQHITLKDLHGLIDQLDIRPEVKTELKNLRVSEYIGDAVRICDAVITRAEKEIG